jgi:quinol monooxygenase YgiN
MSHALVIIRGRAQSGRRNDVQAAFEQHLAPRAVDNESQRVVVWAADDQDEDGFYLVEVYSDRGAVEANAQAPWFADYMQSVMPLLDGQPDFGSATSRWAKGV